MLFGHKERANSLLQNRQSFLLRKFYIKLGIIRIIKLSPIENTVTLLVYVVQSHSPVE